MNIGEEIKADDNMRSELNTLLSSTGVNMNTQGQRQTDLVGIQGKW